MKKAMKKQSGQILLVVLLIAAVGLTIGLGIVSRTVTDISISRREEESSRVFSVAEAGLEEALKIGAGTVGSVEDITYTVTEVSQQPNEIDFSNKIEEGDVRTVWLVDHRTEDELILSPYYTAESLTICWEDTDPETALEALIFYKDGNDYKIARGAYDAEGRNGFSSLDSGGCSDSLSRKKTISWGGLGITLDNDTFLIALRLRPLYNQTKIKVRGAGGTGGVFPPQTKCYESVASSPSGISRKIKQCQFYKSPPGIFDFALYSESEDLAKERI